MTRVYIDPARKLLTCLKVHYACRRSSSKRNSTETGL